MSAVSECHCLSFECVPEQSLETNTIYSLIVPGHIETIVRFANFERRISPSDLAAAELVYASQLGLDDVDVMTQTAIVTLYAKFLWQVRKDVDGARAIFKTGEGKFDSKFYFSNYIKFEMDQPGMSLFLFFAFVFTSAYVPLLFFVWLFPCCSFFPRLYDIFFLDHIFDDIS